MVTPAPKENAERDEVAREQDPGEHEEELDRRVARNEPEGVAREGGRDLEDDRADCAADERRAPGHCTFREIVPSSVFTLWG
jgi:hypothetical protein